MKSSLIFYAFVLVLGTSLVHSIPNPGGSISTEQDDGLATEFDGQFEQDLQCMNLAVNVDGLVENTDLTDKQFVELFHKLRPSDLGKLVESGIKCGAVGLRHGGVTKITPISRDLVKQANEIAIVAVKNQTDPIAQVGQFILEAGNPQEAIERMLKTEGPNGKPLLATIEPEDHDAGMLAMFEEEIASRAAGDEPILANSDEYLKNAVIGLKFSRDNAEEILAALKSADSETEKATEGEAEATVQSG